MPHKCTQCGHKVQDGSDSIFTGCPSCENEKWEYFDDKMDREREEAFEEEAQHKARTEIVNMDEISGGSVTGSDLQYADVDSSLNDGKTVSDMSVVREELNQQYDEGVTLVKEGQYKIDLMELYHGSDYIIEIGEDGSYTVKNSKSK